MAEDRGKLSLRLYDILERVGASESIRRLHRQTATTTGLLRGLTRSMLSGKVLHSYVCGSHYEGSVTPDLRSDGDIVNSFDTLPVVLDPKTVPLGVFLTIVRDDWTQPGYVKLQYVVNGRPVTNNDINVPVVYTNGMVTTDRVGKLCLNHYKGENMKGPADMRIDQNGYHYLDYVCAVRCEGIPEFAREWIIRPRMHGWPSQQQIIDMSKMGCLFVGVGHVDSEEKEVEWRLSFSLQERLLMSSLNPVQHKVYILLKLIKKEILEKFLQEQALTSYHCKTCVLHVTENTPLRVWTQDNIIYCLELCLTVMLNWIRNGVCPNYFLKDQNLFDREEFRRLRYPLLGLIRCLLQTGHEFLYQLQSDQIGEMLKDGGLRVNCDLQTSNKRFMILTLKYEEVVKKILTYPLVLYIIQHDVSRFFSNLQIIQKTHSEQEMKTALAYLSPWLHLHIAMGYASGAYREIDIQANQRIMKLSDFHFELAKKTDLVNKRLASVSVLFKSGNYDTCLLLLQQIDQELTSRVHTVCPCTLTGIRHPNQYPISEAVSSMSVTEIMTSLIASCVIFLPSEFEITPVPLQYEMLRSLGTLPGSRDTDDYWFDFAAVDAKVFLYFMLYMVSTKLDKNNNKRVALDNLHLTVQEDLDDTCHKETAYNLLGWIYLQEQRVADAVRCFRDSWKIRPFHNAAKFPIMDILDRLPVRQVHRTRPVIGTPTVNRQLDIIETLKTFCKGWKPLKKTMLNKKKP